MDFSNLESNLIRQKKTANNLRKNLSGRVSGFSEQQKVGAYNQLDKDNQQADKNLNRRGMLYSGANAAGKTERAGDMAQALAKRQSEFSRGQRNLSQASDDQAVNTGLMLQGAKQARENAISRSALQELGMEQQAEQMAAQRRSQNMASGFQAVGGLIGTMGGSAGGDRTAQLGGTPTTDPTLLKHRYNYFGSGK